MVARIEDAEVNDNSKSPSTRSSPTGPFGVSAAVLPTSFYGQKSSSHNVQTNHSIQSTSKTPPTLPKRKESMAGSSHTTYLPPQSTFGNSNYREPELIPEEDEPTMRSSTGNSWTSGTFDNSAWPQPDFGRLEPATWPDVQLIEDTYGLADPPIDGRDDVAERRWWDEQTVQAVPHPGPGLLPPLLADALHNSEHTLFSVSVSQPDIQPSTQPSGSASPPLVPTSPSASKPGFPSSVKPNGHNRSSSSSSNSSTPTSDEVRQAIPHPNAYYCRRHNGWVILAWRSSSILPSLANSFKKLAHAPFPDRYRRKKTLNCLEETPFEKQNKTHHFHLYEKAVDARHMVPKYVPRAWEKAERSKQSRRRMTIGSDALDPDVFRRATSGDLQSEMETQLVTGAKEEEESQDLLDLYVCCQCSFYVLVSDIIPGAIPSKYVDDFVAEKNRNPSVGKTQEQSVNAALETVMTVIENKLWRGNNRNLSVHGKSFSSKVGWSVTVTKLFESIGFMQNQSTPIEGTAPQTMLHPPNTDPNTEEGRINRERLLRAWVELGAIIANYRHRFPNALKDHNPLKLWVKIESVRETYQTKIGAHPDQIKRGRLPDCLDANGSTNLSEEWERLGMTKTTYDSELLHFAYLAQCRCDPQNTLDYFQSLVNIVDALRDGASCPASLETVICSERSRGRFTFRDVEMSIYELGFGADNALRVDYDEDDVDDAFIKSAWRDAIRRSWTDVDGAVKRHVVNEAFRIVAESRHSSELVEAWNDEITNGMTPDRAYSTLEVPMGVDEDMLITVYNMRVDDQPSSLDKMRDAMRIIAEFTRSERLQKFLNTGSDPGVVVSPTRFDWPRGVNQLGNTCYLNSLLQYFYTIKDLRDAIAPLAIADENEKFMDNDKLKDDDLKNHRVGGRIVSRHEVIRSRKFVSQLANLFWHLENSESASVTPSLELAKLALVTSKDEEEDDPERSGTDSSHSTDATLVDEPVPTTALRESNSPQPKSPGSVSLIGSSVLGKRPRSFSRKKPDDSTSTESSAVEEQNKDKDGYVLVSKPSGSNTPMTGTDIDAEGDVEINETVSGSAAGTSTQAVSKAPPLPPRSKTQSSDSDMMFGKQHDVAECMDNCIFQIETALLQFGELVGPDDSNKRSIVKRYASDSRLHRIRAEQSPHYMNAKIFFSHLPVNVSEESFDLYDGLSGYFDDVVEYEGTKAKMEVSLVELPPILQIQLQRVQFNRDTLQPYKSHAYVRFGESIYMDRFLDDAPSKKKLKSKEIQAELNLCRERIHHLTQGKHAPFVQSLDDSYVFLTAQTALSLPEATNDLAKSLLNEREFVVHEIDAKRARIVELKTQLEDIWRDEQRAEYELTSVFVHRGASPSFGHYFIYQRWLPEHKDEWFKYNDSDVSVVSKEEVLADTTGNTANPYLLVFSRKGSRVIQTVQRADPMAVE